MERSQSNFHRPVISMMHQNLWGAHQRLSYVHLRTIGLRPFLVHRGCTWKAERGLRGIPRSVDPFQGARHGLLKIGGMEGRPKAQCIWQWLVKGWGIAKNWDIPFKIHSAFPRYRWKLHGTGDRAAKRENHLRHRAGVEGLTTKVTQWPPNAGGWSPKYSELSRISPVLSSQTLLG